MNEPDEKPSPYRWVILAVGILAYGTSQFSRQNYAGIQKFIAADLHIDSPLRGLDRYEGAPVEKLRGATRHAFENLVAIS